MHRHCFQRWVCVIVGEILLRYFGMSFRISWAFLMSLSSLLSLLLCGQYLRGVCFEVTWYLLILQSFQDVWWKFYNVEQVCLDELEWLLHPQHPFSSAVAPTWACDYARFSFWLSSLSPCGSLPYWLWCSCLATFELRSSFFSLALVLFCLEPGIHLGSSGAKQNWGFSPSWSSIPAPSDCVFCWH